MALTRLEATPKNNQTRIGHNSFCVQGETRNIEPFLMINEQFQTDQFLARIDSQKLEFKFNSIILFDLLKDTKITAPITFFLVFVFFFFCLTKEYPILLFKNIYNMNILVYIYR